MPVEFLCGREIISLELPESARIYASSFPDVTKGPDALVAEALHAPRGAAPLAEAIRTRRPGKVVIVVSDITRPIPYATFLPQMLADLEAQGVIREEILILVATGMHRESTRAEHIAMFGEAVVNHYAIVDHRAEAEEDLKELGKTSWSGNAITLNRHFVDAGYRIITGLVEPHFMAGFSGGRKAVCPGLSSLGTVRQFHGAAFLANPLARNANLTGNPLHEEALSVAKAVGVDYSLNVVLNHERTVFAAFAGELEAAHKAACDCMRACACPSVTDEADIAITSGGGYPLDTTFYQCNKGIVSCLPAVRQGGEILAFGGCSEGIGSPEYAGVLQKYSGRWREFLVDITENGMFIKDQWLLQMQCRALERVGEENLHFFSPGLDTETLNTLSVNGHGGTVDEIRQAIQARIDAAVREGKSLAAFPEGPYCAPIAE